MQTETSEPKSSAPDDVEMETPAVSSSPQKKKSTLDQYFGLKD